MRVFPVSQHTPGQVLSKLIKERGEDFMPTVVPIGKRYADRQRRACKGYSKGSISLFGRNNDSYL